MGDELTPAQIGTICVVTLLLFAGLLLRNLLQRTSPGYPEWMREKERRPARRLLALDLFLVLVLTSFGGVGHRTEQFWDDGWALAWQQTAGDWVAFAMGSALVGGALFALAFGLETPQGQSVSYRRKLARRQKERDAAVSRTLRADLPEVDPTLIKRVMIKPHGLTFTSVAVLRKVMAGGSVHLSRWQWRRNLQLRKFAPSRRDLGDRTGVPQTFRSTAIHEAGHTVANKALGTSTFAVQILGTGTGETNGEPYESVEYDEHYVEREAWRGLISSLAGQVAETHGQRTLFQNGSLNDWFTAVRHANELFSTEAELDGIRPADGPTAWIVAAHAEAVALVQVNQDSIESVADALEEARTGDVAGLGPRALEKILEDVVPVSTDRVKHRNYSRRAYE